MRWAVERPTKDITQWNPHFAWKPVTFEGYTYWLCWVNRRALSTFGDDPEHGEITWQYTTVVWYP